MTALRYMLKKGSDKRSFPMLIAHGARGDPRNLEGGCAAELMRKKKDGDFQKMAEQLRCKPALANDLLNSTIRPDR